MVKYQQAVALGLGVEKGKYKGGEKEGQNPEKQKTKFSHHTVVIAVRVTWILKLFLQSGGWEWWPLACEIKTWT